MTSSSTACSNLPSYPESFYCCAGGGLVNGSPLICGGTWVYSCYAFDKSSNKWKLHLNLNSKRNHHGYTVLKDTLFSTGGWDDSTTLASSDYVYANGTVENGPNLPEARQGHCMVTLHDDKVMIMGGSLSRNVLIFDPADKSYTNGPSMTYGRGFFGCALFKSALHNNRPVVLAAGGQLVNTEVYDYTYANQWETSINYTSLYL